VKLDVKHNYMQHDEEYFRHQEWYGSNLSLCSEKFILSYQHYESD
jgi:hypothetical protein